MQRLVAAKDAVVDRLRSMWSAQQLAVHYLIADTRRHKKGVAIGVFTVMLVVMLVSVLENSVSRSPVIFWRIAETSVGETDLLLTNGFGVEGIQSVEGSASGGSAATGGAGLTKVLVDQAYVTKSLRGVESVAGTSGRWILFGRILDPATTAEAGTGTAANSSSAHAASAFLLGIDSATESAIGLGRSWSRPALGDREIYLTRSIVREIGWDPSTASGRTVTLRIDLLDVVQTLQVGGVNSGSTSGTGEGANSSSTHSQSESEQLAEEVLEDSLSDSEKKARILRLLLERGDPSLSGLWDRPVDFGRNADVVQALVGFVNASTWSSLPTSSSVIPFPVFPEWTPGLQPLPAPLVPFVGLIEKRTGMNALEAEVALAGFIASAGLSGANATSSALASILSQVVLDPSTLQGHLLRLQNSTETYGEVLDLLLPSFLGLMRSDTPFVVRGVVSEPDGKWADSLGSVVVLESRALVGLLAQAVERVLDLSAGNVTTPVIPSAPIDPIPGGPPIPQPPSPFPALPPGSYPLEFLLSLFLPPSNISALHAGLSLLDSSAQELRNNTRALLGVVEYSRRLSVYQLDLDSMNRDLIAFTNLVSLDGVGFDYPLTYTLPLALAMKITVYARYFLDNIFGCTLALLTLLGMLLIYSLLLNDVDSKTYEYGMLRALGMRHRTLMQILLTKSAAFSVAGIAAGLLFAFLANIPLAQKIAAFARVEAVYSLAAGPVGLAVALGVFMPAVANIVPISRALGQTLRDSLDVYHVVVSEVAVRVVKLAELGVDLWQSAVSVLLIVVGFATFYVIPYAFTFQNIPLFLGILNTILLGMLLGLCIVAQLVQPMLEKLVLRAMLFAVCRPHRKLYSLVVKNLAAHSPRNAKTGQMFVICLAFLIFAGVMFNLQASSLADNIKVYAGADIQVFSPLRSPSQHLREREMRAYLDANIARRVGGDSSAVVEDYSFVSYPLQYLLPVERSVISSLPQFPLARNLVWGVEANYLSVCYDQFLSLADSAAGRLSSSDIPRTRHGGVDVVKLMFLDAGGVEFGRSGAAPQDISSAPAGLSISTRPNETAITGAIDQAYAEHLDVLVSEALAGASSVSLATPLHLSVQSWNDNVFLQHDYLAKARAMVIKMPGFFFSSYRQTVYQSSVVMSMPAYHRVMSDAYGTYPVPDLAPKQKLMIRLTDSATLDQREDVVNGLRTFFKSDKTQAINTASLIGTMAQAIALMNLFFQLVGGIAMVMCFFILWLSFTANVEENAWEFGVLRAIGLNSVQVVMLYVYEALALVIASVVLGTGIGILIAATLTLQFNLFTELPFHMQFPTPLFLSMTIMALLVAVLGSGLPAYSFLSKSISSVLRRQ